MARTSSLFILTTSYLYDNEWHDVFCVIQIDGNQRSIPDDNLLFAILFALNGRYYRSVSDKRIMLTSQLCRVDVQVILGRCTM